MNDDKNHIEYLDLITSKLSGEITPEQDKALTAWLAQDAENSRIFESYRHTWQAMDRVQGKTTREAEEAWSRLEQAINFGEVAVHQPKERSLFRVLYRYAAVLLFMGFMAFLAYYFLASPGQQSVVAVAKVQQVALEEGTKVTINAHSKLTYPKKFEKEKREVALSGEAYFKVARDPERPFIIKAGSLRVEVLGTEFNVRAYEQDNQIEVTVASGRVAVYDPAKPDQRTVLVKGQKAIFYKATARIEAALNDNINFDAWKTRKIIFEDTPMPEVVRIINNIYQSNIRLQGDVLNDCPVTATFDNHDIESVLRVLQTTLNLTVTHQGQTIIIAGEGC